MMAMPLEKVKEISKKKLDWIHSPNPEEKWDLELSIPGTKYLFEKKTSTCHRLIWGLVLLAALCCLLAVVIIRLQILRSNPKSVNVAVEYNPPVAFPRVTICNKNLFRASYVYGYGKAAFNDTKNPFVVFCQLSIYQFVTDYFVHVYRSHGHPKINMSDFATKYKDILEGPSDFYVFYDKSAHLIENMIVQCSWKGQPCGAEHFTKIMTDSGFCYEFNGSPDNPLTTEAAGPGGGLRLVLNSETYDYMPSWDMSAGFLVTVTHQNDTQTTVKNIALQVSPGMQTYMGIKISQFHEIYESSNSTCSIAESLNHCTLKCQSAYAIDKCSCKEVYMPVDNVKTCTPFEIINCTGPALDTLVRLYNYSSYCDCLPACNRVSHDMTVSQSSFADSAMTQTALRNADVDPELNEPLRIQKLSYLDAYSRQIAEFLHYNINIRTSDLVFVNSMLSNYHNVTFIRSSVENAIRLNLSDNETNCLWMQTELILHTLDNLYHWLGDQDLTSHTSSTGHSDDFLVLLLEDILNQRFTFEKWLDDYQAFIDTFTKSVIGTQECITGIKWSWLEAFLDGYLYMAKHQKELLYSIRVDYHKASDMFLQDDLLSKIPQKLNKKTREWYKENIAFLDIFLERLTVMKVQQNSDDSFNAFICDVGGSVGLYLGGSLLTIMEIVDILIWLYTRKKNKTKVLEFDEKY